MFFIPWSHILCKEYDRLTIKPPDWLLFSTYDHLLKNSIKIIYLILPDLNYLKCILMISLTLNTAPPPVFLVDKSSSLLLRIFECILHVLEISNIDIETKNNLSYHTCSRHKMNILLGV